MKALLLTEYNKFSLTDMPRPTYGPNDLLVRVAACGICGSDVHGYDGGSGRRIPPIVMGHEASGIVEEAGAQVSKFKVGDRVTFDSTVSCGQCAFCKGGNINLCDNRKVLGVSCGDYRQHGAFAEYVVVPQHITYKLPEGLKIEQAAMIEAVSIAVHAVKRAAVKPGETTVVWGAGMIGQLIVQTLRAYNCSPIAVVDMDDTRLAMAKKSGAGETINAKTTDATKRILELTKGRGADSVFEAVGASTTVNAAIMATRKGGTVTLVGNISPKIELPLQIVVSRELSLLGSCASNGEYPECLELLASGKIDVGPLISAVAPLEEGPQWFDRLHRAEPGLMKVLLKP